MTRKVLLVLVLTGTACGGRASQAPPPDMATASAADNAASAPAEPEIAGPPKPWEEMSHEEKEGYMMQQVLPVMAQTFQEYDAEEFASFGCKTCHGPNAGDVDFRMPSTGLPRMYPTGSPEQQHMIQEEEDEARFMFQKVVPRMAKLLGIPRYSDETGEGFTCYYCHPGGRSETHGVSPLARDQQEAEAEPSEATEGLSEQQ